MSNIPGSARVLLDFLGRTETGVDGAAQYLTIIGHREGKLPKPLTDYTLDELLAAQKVWGKNWRSSAAGKYQIIRATLAGLIKQIGLRGDQHFTPDLQDLLGYTLLRNRGFDRFIAGTMPFNAFALELAKEWASMPVLEPVTNSKGLNLVAGQSYYANDGLNRALVKPDDLRAVLSRALNEADRDVRASQKPQETPKPVPAPSSPAPKPVSWLSALVAFIVSLLKRLGKKG